MSIAIAEKDLPVELTTEQAVEAAYAAELAEVSSKLQRGLPITAPPTAELKASQRDWFILLYQLLIGKDTGPRLPTLLMALGQDRVRSLLTPG